MTNIAKLLTFTLYMTETNSLTNAVIQFLQLKGHFVSRIQSQGQYHPKRGMWIKSKVRRGIGDIIACINGEFWMIEIKTGKDRQSEYQKEVEKDVKKSGGKYIIVSKFGEFLGYYMSGGVDSDTSEGGDNKQPDQKTGTRLPKRKNRISSKPS
jgi:hypothetical protein